MFTGMVTSGKEKKYVLCALFTAIGQQRSYHIQIILNLSECERYQEMKSNSMKMFHAIYSLHELGKLGVAVDTFLNNRARRKSFPSFEVLFFCVYVVV